ncbi:aldolase catalytic domain-containing protein [Akkermansiaceae bacterium]|nr:aldolase catalytic domain-containing protein [Akkermansiaceae bacterium]
MKVLPKILDCTLRDGGYYTNWDFESTIVNTYIRSFNKLPIDYLELGYRNPKSEGYYGEYFYCPERKLEVLRASSNKKLAIILNEKDISIRSLDQLLDPCVGKIEMVRLAVDPKNFQRAIVLANEVKKKGFEISFNLMYMSQWSKYEGLFDKFKELDHLVDFLYLVDSFGSIIPNQIPGIIRKVRAKTNCQLGFHGHNNLELALANTLTAIDQGIDIVDATVAGMGRGAGNLKTELLLTTFNKQHSLEIDFNALSETLDDFQKLQDFYKWGTALPYMVSGANSLPQKEVMDWVGKRYYSLNSIIRALNNKKASKLDNVKLKTFRPSGNVHEILIVGGGNTVKVHREAIVAFAKKHTALTIIHASSRNAAVFDGVDCRQYFCLVGNEGVRLEQVFHDLSKFEHQCILPPFPRAMGTYIPRALEPLAFELGSVNFTDDLKDTHSALALQVSEELSANHIYLVGFDGYDQASINSRERELLMENEKLFECFTQYYQKQLVALTPTKYESLKKSSIYC